MFSVKRDQIVQIKEKTSKDWWLVSTVTDIERIGFVPCNYIKELSIQRVDSKDNTKNELASQQSTSSKHFNWLLDL